MAKTSKSKKTAKKTAKRAAKKTAKKTAKAAKKTTKRTAKKTAPTKKKTAKPSVKVTITRKALGKAPETHTFYLQDGRRLDSLYELIDELETMTEHTFQHYVNEFENHFANWVEHVFHDRPLAHEMRLINDRLETQRALLKHLVRELTKEVHEKQ